MIALWLTWALAVEGTVTLPLDAVEAVEAAPVRVAPQALLSRATWSGRVDERGAIELDAVLQVSLTGDGYKSVPLVGLEAVLQEVSVNGEVVPVDRVGGFHHWHTDATGPATVRIRGWVPPAGQGGSLEYDLPIPTTPSTRVVLELPRDDLRPEVRDAVRVDVVPRDGRSVLTADLAPTARLHVLGLRDLASEDGRPAELYAQTSQLVSVEDHRVEVFAVVRYSILYGSARQFEVFVPDGLSVVEADGEGGLSWELAPTDGGQLLRGRTRHPIRNQYEMSLRLQRNVEEGEQSLALPSARGVKRERGWVGLEVPGRVRLTDRDGGAQQRLPAQQLPSEVRDASVSPILDAWRLGSQAELSWRAERLPAVEVSSERIDQVSARTVLAAGGRVVTELTLQLQNRSRHGVTLTLPAGAEVTRALRDGVPVTPAAGDEGVVLPLRRTMAGEAQTLSVTIRHDGTAPGWWGRQSLTLPELDIPVAALWWDLALPESHRWSELTSDVACQSQVGSGSWLADGGGVQRLPTGAAVAPAGASESRSYQRFWLDAHTPVRAEVGYRIPWLWTLSRLLLVVLSMSLAAGGTLLGWRRWHVSKEE